jgi:hypothetical protein
VRTIAALLITFALAACAQHGTSVPGPPSRIGVYRFTEHPAQLRTPIQGRLFITHDSVVVEAEPGPCRYDVHSASSGPIVYQCADVTLSFDRLDPVGKSTYRTTTTVMDRRTTCARYATDSSGRQVCVQQQTETNERQVPVTGTLHLEIVAHPN